MNAKTLLSKVTHTVGAGLAVAALLWNPSAIAAPNALLGLQVSYPDTFFSSTPGQGCNYNGTSLTVTSQPLTITFTAGGLPTFITSGVLTITANIDASGAFFGGSFSMTGIAGSYGSPLLTGAVTNYGIADFGPVGGTDRAEFLMTASGGSLVTGAVIASGAAVGALVTMENSNYSGSFGSSWTCGIAKGNLGPTPVVGGGTGTGTIGYWKTHPEAWPVTSLTLGNVTYNQTQLLAILKLAVKGDKSISLSQQLIGAKLNVAAGNTSSCISGTITAADTWLINHGGVASGQKQWDGGDVLHDDLDAYNNGELCAPHRG